MSLVKVRVWHKKLEEYVEPSRYLVISREGELCSEDCDIEQYTGLKDKNGVDIYEGDIYIDTHDDTRVMEWDEGMEPFGAYFERPDEWTVIGNIHQNPELINQ